MQIFRDESVRIMQSIAKVSPTCQVLLFSATFDDGVKAIISKIFEEIFADGYNSLFVKEELFPKHLKLYKVYCPNVNSKTVVVRDQILELGEKVGQTIVFVNSGRTALNLHQSLTSRGWGVSIFEGSMSQEERDKNIGQFKDGITQVLISTDLLSRGFDQRRVNLVINFDLPVRYDNPSEPAYEVYLHRVGRAGRFDDEGAVFNILGNGRDDDYMYKIENYFNADVSKVSPWHNDAKFEEALKNAGLL